MKLSSKPYDLFASAPKNVEDLLADELRELGASAVELRPSGVAFQGDLEVAYRACLESRLAGRVVMHLARFAAPDAEALYRGVRDLDWSAHIPAGATLAVDATTKRSGLTHSHFVALKVKDAIVDQLRDQTGTRPSIDVRGADFRVNVHVDRDEAFVRVDLSGGSLHRRGYRAAAREAPIKENLAAALLLRAGWPELANAGGGLVDPMCGSGTLLIEAAWMAAGVAPGLLRERFGTHGWRGHDAALWASVHAASKRRAGEGLGGLEPGRIAGSDCDPKAVAAARRNLERAGLGDRVTVRVADVSEAVPTAATGLLCTNAPYGERLGDADSLRPIYARLGERIGGPFSAWHAAVLTADPILGKALGVRASRRNAFYNGALECTLLRFEPGAAALGARRPPPEPSPAAKSFHNRLRKNLSRLGPWAERRGITCYRLYDADIPEYAFAVDLYEGRAHVQEYAPPTSVDPDAARLRRRDVLGTVPGALGIDPGDVYVKTRRKQKGGGQYQRQGERGAVFEVGEGGHRFRVNLSDYLDTGLFLDHRLTRALIGELAAGRSFLNLFAYTGAATVYAAKGGAPRTTSVDLSNTYGAWCEANLALNGIGGSRHEVLKADALKFVEAERRAERRRYDLIFLDPPTFSRSAAMETTLDIQRDHVQLLTDTAGLLAPGGVLVFSTNFRRFKLDREALGDLAIEDITADTLDEDFARNPRIHTCFRIERQG